MDKRIFLFGCPRSGTTLLQVILARHPNVHSLPESFFFSLTIGYRRRLLARLNISTGKEKEGLIKISEILGLEPSVLPYKKSLHYKPTVDTFIHYLDTITIAHGKSIWVEKTPFHINYIDIIEKYVPKVHFIHIIRDGKDTVSSIVDRAYHHDANLFTEKEKNPSYGIKKWNKAMQISLKYLDDPRHSFVSYEALCQEPDTVLGKLCQDLGFSYLASMKNPTSDSLTGDLTKYAHLKESSKVISASKSKFGDLFDLQARNNIIKELDWKKYDRIKERIEKELKSYIY